MENHRTKILGFTFLLAGFALWAGGLWLLLGPAQYQAAARVNLNIGSEPQAIESEFIEIECEIIQDPVVLSNVVEALNLSAKWGSGGSQRKSAETLGLLKRRVTVRDVPNDPYLIEIRATSEDPNEAAKIANAISEAYREYRFKQRRQLMRAAIRVLNEQYQNDEAKIQILQTNVDLLRTKYQINNQDEVDFDHPEITVSRSMTPAEREERQKEYERTTPFWDEKRKLIPILEFHKLLKMKIESERANLDQPSFSMIEIIKAAVPPQTPGGPDRVLGALLCAIGLFPAAGGFLLFKASLRPSG